VAASDSCEDNGGKRIMVQHHGPYLVHGHVALVRKSQVVSEHGEPLTWKKEETLEVPESYSLCRCGQSQQKPFCDGTHREIGFDGTETADTGLTAERQVRCQGGRHIQVKSDASLCMNSGFCRTRQATIEQLVLATEDTGVRSQVIAMVERCPSGSLTYAVDPEGPDIEPDLPQQVAVTTEMTSEGPIEGPLWVTGNIPVERADGQPFETRNRVTLCHCGLSRAMPLCDGTHRPAEGGETEKA
jgi:CDGSH-type Zn-finger protein